MKNSLVHRVLKPLLNVGTSSFHLSNFERILGSKIGYVHVTCCPKSRISLCKASLAHPS